MLSAFGQALLCLFQNSLIYVLTIPSEACANSSMPVVCLRFDPIFVRNFIRLLILIFEGYLHLISGSISSGRLSDKILGVTECTPCLSFDHGTPRPPNSLAGNSSLLLPQ